MKNNKCKHYVTLVTAILGFGIINLNQVEAAKEQESTTTTASSAVAPIGVEIADPTDQLRAPETWVEPGYIPLPQASFFRDVNKIAEPIDSRYAFNLSVRKGTEIIGAPLHPEYNEWPRKYVNVSEMAKGDKFMVVNAGFYLGRSIDLEITIDNYYIDPDPLSGQVKGTANIMFDDNFFAGINFLKTAAGAGVELTYRTIDSVTKEEVKTSGVLPYNNSTRPRRLSLDANLIEAVYAPQGSVVKYKEDVPSTGMIAFASDVLTTGGGAAAIGPERAVTVLYDKKSTRKFKFDQLGSGGGYVMEPRNPIPIAAPKPSLKGNDYDKEPDMYYEIDQYVPLEPYDSKFPDDDEFLFKDFVFEFPLKKALAKVDTSKIVLSNDRGLKLIQGKDYKVTSTIEADGGETLDIQISKEFRLQNKSDDFYGRVITAHVPVQVDPTEDLTEYLTQPDKKRIKIPLIAKTKIDDFYKTVTSNQAFAETTNEGQMTITHVDEKGNVLRKDAEITDLLETKWTEPYTDNGGYVKNKIFLNDDTNEVSEITIKGYENKYKVTFFDKRFDYSMGASSPDDTTGATAKQDEDITYKLKVASKAGKSYVTPNENNYKSVKVTLDDYNTKLLNNPGEAELQLVTGDVVSKASYDDGTNSYSFDIIADTLWSKELYVVFKTKIKSDATIGEKI